MRASITLYNAQQAYQAIAAVWHEIKPYLIAGHELVLEVKQAKRSDAENRLLHAMLTYISKNHQWAGQKHDVETWKRLVVAAWCRANGESVKILPALDGQGVDIVFRRTSELTRAECADLITFVYAWGAENDVQFPADPRQVESVRMLEAA